MLLSQVIIDVSNSDPSQLKRSKRTGGVSGGNTHDPDPELEPRSKQVKRPRQIIEWIKGTGGVVKSY